MIAICLFIMILSLIVGFVVGSYLEHKDWVRWLVKTKRAEYYLDKNNERQWRMNK